MRKSRALASLSKAAKAQAEAMAYDAWAEYYDVSLGDRSPCIQFYCSLVRPHTRRVLDLGCGSGIITDALEKYFQNFSRGALGLIGLDGSPQMLELARQRNGNIRWIFGDLKNPPLCGQFDLVVASCNTLQLFNGSGLSAVIKAARSLVRRGGIFAFDAPFAGSLG